MPLSDGRLTIKMPNNWQKVDDGKLPVGVSSVGCRPKDNANVELNIYYRGSHLDPEAAKRFHDLLSKPPHLLSSDELKQVSQALRDKANPENFKILSAKTETINGRTVLSIEGSYRQFDVRAQVKYVDSEADGSIVREVSYTAPAKDYAKYILAAQKSFSSLIGK